MYIDREAVVRGGRHLIWDEEAPVREANRVMLATIRRAGLPENFAIFSSCTVR